MFFWRRLCAVCTAAHPHSAASRRPITGIGVRIASIGRETNETTTVRGRLERVRVRGKLSFIQIRQPPGDSLQAVASGAAMAQQVKGLTPESIIDVTGTIARASQPVLGATCSAYEMHAQCIRVVSPAATPLPFPLRDNSTKLDTRLDHRVIDMRTTLTSSVMRIMSVICQSFREQLLARDFIEIHTPKLTSTASEGGSAVFALDYFGQPAFLAQSPQLYKQMALMGDAMRVFEIGPVFRAEKSLTHRHLTEFIGLDAELVIGESYTEALDVLEATLAGVIHTLQGKYAALVRRAQDALALTSPTAGPRDPSIVSEVPPEILSAFAIGDDTAARSSGDLFGARIGGTGPRVLRIPFHGAALMLAQAGAADPHTEIEDFTLPQERRLGELVRERYGVDVYVVDAFPAAARPFYTMPHPRVPGATCGYDMYLRGEEICSGAQRQHDPAALIAAIAARGIDVDLVKDYVNAFRYGAWPHGGFGLGLERIALFFLGARDIRQVSLFPRDPKRLAP